MKREIAQFVNECDVCRRVKAEQQRPAGLLQPLAILEWKFDHIEMDFVTLEIPSRSPSQCDVCRRVKEEHQRPAGLLQPLAIP